MSWLQRIFGQDKPADPQAAMSGSAAGGEAIAPERVGLNGEYDESGLAKRVALAFDESAELADENELWVAQTSGTVVLKGKVSSQNALNSMIDIANSVNGSTSVDTSQVTVA